MRTTSPRYQLGQIVGYQGSVKGFDGVRFRVDAVVAVSQEHAGCVAALGVDPERIRKALQPRAALQQGEVQCLVQK